MSSRAGGGRGRVTRVTTAVVRKELAVLWLSPVPYVVAAVFNAVLGLLYVNQLEGRQQALLQPLFPLAGFLLVLVVPVLSMRAFADEARTGALDLLLAVPVRVRPLVVGKWLATWLTALAVLAPSLVFVALVGWWGDPDPGPGVAGYLGLALLAAALCGVGVLASALTDSQPVAAMAALFAAVLLWFASAAGATGVLVRLSLSERLRGFAGGVVDSADAGFFAALSAAALAVAAAAVARRRGR